MKETACVTETRLPPPQAAELNGPERARAGLGSEEGETAEIDLAQCRQCPYSGCPNSEWCSLWYFLVFTI